MHRRNKILLIALLIVIVSGIAMKMTFGHAPAFLANQMAGFFYVLFWILAARLVLPGSGNAVLVLSVVLGTCALEFLQLSDAALLEWIRKSVVGRSLIGSSFNVTDFFYYLLAGIVGWLFLGWLDGRYSEKE